MGKILIRADESTITSGLTVHYYRMVTVTHTHHVPEHMIYYSSPRNIAKHLVWYILTLLEVVLAFRFVFKLVGANPAAAFTDFIYSITQPFVAPFLNVITPARVEGSFVEWASMLAMVVYWIVAWAIVRLITIDRSVETTV